MTRETRVGLLVGLLFIVMFGLVLSELAGKPPKSVSPPGIAKGVSRGNDLAGLTDPSPLIARRSEPAPGKEESVVEVSPGSGRESVVEVAVLPAGSGTSRGRVDAHLVREVTPGPTTRPAGPVVAVGPTTRPATAGQKYVIQPKDTLIKIARRYYGDGFTREYTRILEANKGVLTHETVLPVGKEIVIPPLPESVRGTGAAGAAPAVAGRPMPTTAPAIAARPRPTTMPAEPVGRATMTTEELARHFAGAGSPAVASGTPTRKTYVIQKGDSLMKIARDYLKDGSHAAVQRLYNANKDKLSSPDVLPVGTSLTIPS
jgi:nucleoid-associated protein YgaU